MAKRTKATRPKRAMAKAAGGGVAPGLVPFRVVNDGEPEAPKRVGLHTDAVREAAIECACEAVAMLETVEVIAITRTIAKHVREYGGHVLTGGEARLRALQSLMDSASPPVKGG